MKHTTILNRSIYLLYLSPYILSDIHVCADYCYYSQRIPRFLLMACHCVFLHLLYDVFTRVYECNLSPFWSERARQECVARVRYSYTTNRLTRWFLILTPKPCPTDCWQFHILDHSCTVSISIQPFVEQHQAIIRFCVFILSSGRWEDSLGYTGPCNFHYNYINVYIYICVCLCGDVCVHIYVCRCI